MESITCAILKGHNFEHFILREPVKNIPKGVLSKFSMLLFAFTYPPKIGKICPGSTTLKELKLPVNFKSNFCVHFLFLLDNPVKGYG